jgi:hypothetical protein
VFESLMDKNHDFPFNKCHSLAKFYGLADFVIMSPAGNEMLTSEDRINLLLSSVTIAVNNVQRYTIDLEFFLLFTYLLTYFDCPKKQSSSGFCSVTFQVAATLSRNI